MYSNFTALASICETLGLKPSTEQKEKKNAVTGYKCKRQGKNSHNQNKGFFFQIGLNSI